MKKNEKGVRLASGTEKIEIALSNEIADSGFPTETTVAKTVPKYHRSKKLQKQIDQALADTPFRDRLLDVAKTVPKESKSKSFDMSKFGARF